MLLLILPKNNAKSEDLVIYVKVRHKTNYRNKSSIYYDFYIALRVLHSYFSGMSSSIFQSPSVQDQWHPPKSSLLIDINIEKVSWGPAFDTLPF